MIFPSCLSFGTGFLPLLLKAVRINHEVAAEENPKYTPKPSLLEGHSAFFRHRCFPVRGLEVGKLGGWEVG